LKGFKVPEITLVELNAKLDSILALLGSHPWESNPQEQYKTQSDELGLIAGALAKAQGSYKKLIPNEESANGPYANLEAIRLATGPALSENNIAFYQRVILLDKGSGAALIITYLLHDSGQFISTATRVFSGKTDRATGNTQEIHKRLQAMMLCGIAPSKNDPIAYDDDGGEQEEERLIEGLKKPQTKTLDPNAVVTKDRYNDLLIELDGYETIAENIKETYKIETLADLPNEVYHDALAKIRRIKRTTEDYERRKK
jgi:hypothetical protein